MASRLAQQVALMTGGSADGGLGEAIARRFAAEGARVVCADVNREGAERLARDLGGIAIAADVTQEDQVKALFAACAERAGRLDVLVNNAGIVPGWSTSETLDFAQWDRTFAVNVRGVMLCTKYAVPLLKRQGGAIVNRSSIVGLVADPNQHAYSASKWAVRGITESCARELAQFDIRVNSICPGPVATRALLGRSAARAKAAGRTPEAQLEDEFLTRTWLGRMVAPEDIGEAAFYLATAPAITGIHHPVTYGQVDATMREPPRPARKRG